jgi:hypothetical protein
MMRAETPAALSGEQRPFQCGDVNWHECVRHDASLNHLVGAHDFTVGKAPFDHQVLVFNIAKLAYSLAVCAEMVGRYARLGHGQQAGEFLTAGGAIDPIIDCQISGRCSTSAFGR